MAGQSPVKKPPPLPSEVLRRVLRVARIDGVSVLGFAGACALVSASIRDVTGAVIGLVVAGAGAIELHGAALLRVGSFKGMRWLVSSQAYLMSAILGYAALKLQHPDLALMRRFMAHYSAAAGQDAMDQFNAQLQAQGVTMDQALVGFLTLVYLALAFVTLVYQGGMIVYYMRRREAVAIALEEAEQE
jgi:hypothetical protein